MTRPALLALDGGGSKVDAALLDGTGRVLGAARRRVEGEGLGLAPAIAAACAEAGIDPADRPVADLGMFCVAGADFPADYARIEGQLAGDGWTAATVVRNDTYAVLRAGSDRGWGVAVVCGTGINCTAVAPDGRTFRFPAVGHLSGDWGGGHDIGAAALWHAVRAEDGRGEATLLAETVPGHFGLGRPQEVTEAIHLRRLPEARLVELPPVVFAAAAQGDRVAASIVDRQADEVVAMVGTALRRLGLDGHSGHDGLDVVLGGGIFHNRHAGFLHRIDHGVGEVAGAADVRVVADPPVVGAMLLGLERLGVTADGVRAALTHQRLAGNA